jgi:hypothetical protein
VRRARSGQTERVADDEGGLLCVRGLQHSFVVTGWESVGGQSHWASELLCPTCGTSVTRQRGDDPWQWYAPDPDDG